MGNKRIYELAKELKKSSKDVVEKAQQLGIDVKNHMGAITSSDEKKLQQAFKNPSTKQQAAQQASRKPANQQPNDQRKKETTNNQQKNKNNRSYQDRGQGSGQVNQGKKPTTNQIIREIPAAKIVKERAKAAIKTVLTITTNQTITIAANLIIITVIVIIKKVKKANSNNQLNQLYHHANSVNCQMY